MSVDERIRHRHIERHGAAVIRALADEPTAEFRGHRLRVDQQRIPFASPWLVADPARASVSRNRGVADSLGLRLRHSDFALHRSLSPTAPFAKVVFDILEQLRCESMAPDWTLGMRQNLDAAFEGWAVETDAHRVSESGLGLLLYTVTLMARARLCGSFENESVDGTIEETRANLSPQLGDPLQDLVTHRGDQLAYAEVARAVADLVDEIAGHPERDHRSSSSVARRTGLTIPAGWDESTEEGDMHLDRGTSIAGPSVVDDPQDLDSAGGYHVFTRQFDREVTGISLYSEERRRRLRAELDRQVTGQAVSVPRLAYRLQMLLGRPDVQGWDTLEEEGVLDPARLSQLVTSPSNTQVFRIPRNRPTSPAVVTFLIDQSGSMKRQRFEAVAVLVDTYCRALDLAGAKSEVLGFTTAAWNGGRALTEWRAAGMPDSPGRLAETLHVVYKSADQPWRRARPGIASMADSSHFREGVDGEALTWAYRRLLARPEPRRLLVFISDGSPFEAASANNNRPGFLDDHIVAVARHIERDPRVELGAIGMDLDLGPYVANAVALDLSGTLARRSYDVLHLLFA